MSKPLLSPGDCVKKITGDYHIKGRVLATFDLHANVPKALPAWRHVVRHKAEGGGYFCHIYAEANLIRINPDPTL